MTTIDSLRTFATDKDNFTQVSDWLEFAKRFADYLASGQTQATIVARNEPNYVFYQFGQDAGYQVTRPINSNLYHDATSIDTSVRKLNEILDALKDGQPIDATDRPFLPSVIYTAQQSIGAALDALPAGQSNLARKVNGDLFERFIRLLIESIGIPCHSGVLGVPVKDDDGTELFKMNYQHDLMMTVAGELRVIGSVKTSSKDRIDKIFMDKFLYSRLTGTAVPHIGIFLNDVQRAGKSPDFQVSGTFLPGHFKGYTVKLNALDGVYYCDLRPNMKTDPLLAKHISTIDKLFCDDLPNLVAHKGTELEEVIIIEDDPIADAANPA